MKGKLSSSSSAKLLSSTLPFLQSVSLCSMASSSHSSPPIPEDDELCSSLALCSIDSSSSPSLLSRPTPPEHPIAGLGPVERAWAHWRRLGEPKLIVAPMVDNSELPFRMLCRKYGAQAAYTPMLHSRIFSENEKFRCPQRIARRGNYGAFLMDNLSLVKALVQKLASNLDVPVSCKIRIFPRLEDTLAYAKMLEEAGCSLLAVHGRTRDQKDGKKVRADWDAIKAVKDAIRIPVLANGNVRHLDDVNTCLEVTGVDGVLSAESLLENPALFAGYRVAEWKENEAMEGELNQADLVVEYLKMCEKHPVPWRMIRSHVHKMLGDWFRVHPDIREELNKQSKLSFEWLYDMVKRLRERDVRLPLYIKGYGGVPAC